MKWNIVTDSSCDLFSEVLHNGEIQISSVPFIIKVGEREFIDDETLNTTDVLEAMETYRQASHTSCPPAQTWFEQFEKADFNIAITISSKLSGSINSAVLAKEMVSERYPEKKVALVDSLSAGPEIVMCVQKICDLIKANTEFAEIVSEAKKYLYKSHVVFALSSFNNLVKNGRMSKIAGFVASKLGMWGIGVGSDEGTIAIKGKTRGTERALMMILEDMKERSFSGSKVVISHCHNLILAEKLQNKIREIWQNTEVLIMPTRGLCSYYAERGGLIVSYY